MKAWQGVYRIAGGMGWDKSKWLPLTLRELVVAYDGYLLETWNHTANLAALVFNLTVVVANITSKSRQKMKGMSDFHPYQKTTRHGFRIERRNFDDLRMLGNAMARG